MAHDNVGRVRNTSNNDNSIKGRHRSEEFKSYSQNNQWFDLIKKENTVITMTKLGYIKRMTVDNFKAQHRGGKGIKGIQTIDDDFIEHLFMTTTHHYLMFFTNSGKVYRMKAYEIPESSRTSRGTGMVNLLQLNTGGRITADNGLEEDGEDKYLFMATKNGIVKKTALKEYANVRKTGLAAITLKDGDELIQVKITDNTKNIFMVTKLGMCICFHETDVRSTGRTSQGVIGMNLTDGDEVIGMQMDSQGTDLLIVSEKGMGKRTSLEEFTPQRRGGKGVKCYKINAKTGNVIGMKAVNDENQIMIISTEGIVIRLECSEISQLGRITSGVKLISMDEANDITVASIAKVRDKSPEDSIAEFEAEQAKEEEQNK